MATIFAIPKSVLLQSVQDGTRDGRSQKRKRNTVESSQDDAMQDNTMRYEDSLTDEYTAVVSPEERSQRRLAGQPLGLDPPSHPFPHAKAVTSKYAAEGDQRNTRKTQDSPDLSSLRLQHIACLTALLHRSIASKDFRRAARALGLMLREEVSGHAVDIRASGNWAIAAETLLCLPLQASVNSDTVASLPSLASTKRDPKSTSILTRRGFDAAKAYYEAMIIQHPYHKTWPEAVNVVDLYLAMFNIWIYVVSEESRIGSMTANTDDRESMSDSQLQHRHQEVKLRELHEADQIAERMDKCMASVPLMDNTDLVRLRTMVAWWQVDLNIECQRLAKGLDMHVDAEQFETDTANFDLPPSDEDNSGLLSPDDYSRQAREATNLAHRLTERQKW